MPGMNAKTKKSKGAGPAETMDNEVFVAPRDTGSVFSETKPRGSEGKGYKPMGYNRCFYKILLRSNIVYFPCPQDPLQLACGLRPRSLVSPPLSCIVLPPLTRFQCHFDALFPRLGIPRPWFLFRCEGSTGREHGAPSFVGGLTLGVARCSF